MEIEINQHLEVLEGLEEKVDKDIDEMLAELSVEEILSDPLGTLNVFIEKIDMILDEQYHDAALKEGIIFSNKIRG